MIRDGRDGEPESLSERKWITVSPDQKQVLQALAILCFSKAIQLVIDGLLPGIMRLIVSP